MSLVDNSIVDRIIFIFQHLTLRHFTHVQKAMKILPSVAVPLTCGLLDIQLSIDGNVHSETAAHVHTFDISLTSMYKGRCMT